MFVDALCQLSEDQAVTADAVSENTFDAGNVTPKRQLGTGEPMCVVMVITAIGTNTGSAKIQAIQSAAADLGSPVIVGEVDIVAADLVAGKIVIVPIGQGPAALRYWGANYDITGTVDFTVDTFLMPLSMASRQAESYANGYAIQ
jgi:hypothetical protein